MRQGLDSSPSDALAVTTGLVLGVSSVCCLRLHMYPQPSEFLTCTQELRCGSRALDNPAGQQLLRVLQVQVWGAHNAGISLQLLICNHSMAQVTCPPLRSWVHSKQRPALLLLPALAAAHPLSLLHNAQC